MKWISYVDYEKLEKGAEVYETMEFENDVNTSRFVVGKNQHFSCVTDLFLSFCVDCNHQRRPYVVAALQEEYERVPDGESFQGLYACGLGRREVPRRDFDACVNIFFVEEKKSKAETEELTFSKGSFRGTFAPSAMNVAGKSLRTIFGANNFHRFVGNSVLHRMFKRVQPLTEDEIDCLIEYVKDLTLERHFHDATEDTAVKGEYLTAINSCDHQSRECGTHN